MKVLVAMSGGVDSSVAAYLLKAAGDECVGCTMKLYENEDAGIPKGHTCCALSDVEDARSVAYKLGMDHIVFNFTDDFREKVIDKFVDSYLRCETPNPCVDCNRYMKFDKLLQRADIMNCDAVATGHYARVECVDGRYLLKTAADASKDQTYFLYMLTQRQLERVRFPLGGMTKDEVRTAAEAHGFVNAAKPDSQDICFVPDGDYARVIEQQTGVKSAPGDFVDADGNVLGRHKGLVCYTVGQRRGLGVSSAGEAYYVVRLDPERNAVVLGYERDLYSRELRARDFNWISGDAPTAPIRCEAKIRYRATARPATASVNDDGSVSVVFDEPQRAITAGQAVVLYSGDTVLGGGTILA